MSPSEIDYYAFSLLLLRWFAMAFVVYLIIVMILRVSNFYRIKRCPNCGGEIKRTSRGASERFTKTFSLGILDLKRYRCYTCYWEGSGLPVKKKSQSVIEE